MDLREQIKQRLGSQILEWTEPRRRRIYITIKKEAIVDAARYFFRELGFRFSIASGTDTPQGFEILYHFSDDKSGDLFSLRLLIEDRQHPAVDSITPLFPGAEWIEREMWEMLGIHFTGHPNLKRLLLADDWPEGNYPLRQTNEP